MSIWNVAVVGASGVVGEALIAILEERGFPIGELYLLGSARSAGTRLEFKGRHYRIDELGGFDFARAQIAFFAVSADLARQYAPRAVAAGCAVVDCSSAFRHDQDVPLVLPEVNPQALAGFRPRGLAANPDPTSIQLLMAVHPLHAAATIEHIQVCTLEAVSGRGRAGVEELAGQTAALLNAQPMEPQIFPQQIAFNSLARIDLPLDNGYTETEMDVVWATQRILEDATISVNPSAILAPVFYGYSSMVTIETNQPLTATAAKRLLSKAPGVLVLDGPQPTEIPSPAGVVGTDSVYVGRIRQGLAGPHELNMLIAADNVRKGSALNAVQIGELLVKAYL
mgnify:CR=1 FL=1